MKNNSTKVDIDEIFRQGTPIIEALEEAAQDAIVHHQMTRNPLVYWRDGRVVHVDPFTGAEVDPNDPEILARIRPIPFHLHGL